MSRLLPRTTGTPHAAPAFRRRHAALVPLVAAVAVVVAACGGGSSSSPSASASATPGASASGGGGSTQQASGIGITDDSITIGTIADLTGPVPGLFQGGADGVKAYVEYINSQGGINGRKLVQKVGDSALTCQGATQAASGLVDSTFALVGSWSNFDNCLLDPLNSAKDISYVGYALSSDLRAWPQTYSPHPSPPGFYEGAFKYLKQKFPDATTIGSIYSGTPAGQTTWNDVQDMMKSIGYKIGYGRGAAPSETTFTSDIIRMRNSGVDFLLLNDTDSGTAARVIDTAYQQGWKPKVISCSVCYDANFFKVVNPAAAEGVLADTQWGLYLNSDASNPEVKLFQDWMKKVAPSRPLDLYGAYSWASTAAFVQAAKAAGPDLTRESLQAALKNMHSFDDNGMLPKTDIGAQQPPECWLIVKAQSGDWVREEPTSGGFACDPSGYYHRQ